MKIFFSLLIFVLHVSFPSVIALAYTFSTIENNSGNVGIFVFLLDFLGVFLVFLMRDAAFGLNVYIYYVKEIFIFLIK